MVRAMGDPVAFLFVVKYIIFTVVSFKGFFRGGCGIMGTIHRMFVTCRGRSG